VPDEFGRNDAWKGEDPWQCLDTQQNKGVLTMSISSWFPWKLARQYKGRARPAQAPAFRRRTRLACEQLEDRTVPSSFTAATVSDLIADINAANRTGGNNTILLAANTTFDLVSFDNTTDGRNGLPVIAAGNNLRIVGQSGDIIQRDPSAPNSFRLLDVASGGTLTLSQVTLQGGLAAAPGAGGAIYNPGTLVLSGVTVQNNEAVGNYSSGPAAGGGIWSSGTLTLTNGTLIQSNLASGPPAYNGAGVDAFGGGIWSSGTLTLESGTLVKWNDADGGKGAPNTSGKGGNGFGGGLYIAGGTASLTGATVINNAAAGGDGAMTEKCVWNGWGWYCTWYYTGAGYGGGLYVANGTVTLRGDTVQSNVAAGGLGKQGNGTGYSKAFGGGVFIASKATLYLDAFTLDNTVNNKDSSGTNGSTANIDGSYTLIT
jgi:hypothetical protein